MYTQVYVHPINSQLMRNQGGGFPTTYLFCSLARRTPRRGKETKYTSIYYWPFQFFRGTRVREFFRGSPINLSMAERSLSPWLSPSLSLCSGMRLGEVAVDLVEDAKQFGLQLLRCTIAEQSLRGGIFSHVRRAV